VDARARWRILRLHVEDQVPLARLARETDVGLRTLERWHARYRADGYAGLETASRADAGSRRLPPDLSHSGCRVDVTALDDKRSLPVGTVVSLTRRPFDQGSTARRTWPATLGRQTEGHAATVRCQCPDGVAVLAVLRPVGLPRARGDQFDLDGGGGDGLVGLDG